MTFQEKPQFATPQKILGFTRFFYFLFFILLVIGVFHLLGIYGGFYWRYQWFDLVQHFLGGVWIGGMITWYLSGLNGFITAHSMLAVAIVLVGILTIGIAWEIFEVVIDPLFTAHENYLFDTLTDLIAGVFGAALVSLVYLNFKKTVGEQR